jgi:hypothetical protein
MGIGGRRKPRFGAGLRARQAAMMKLGFLIWLCLASAPSWAKEQISVDMVEVKLFYQYSGRFSLPITSEDFLNNVFLGEYTLEGDTKTEPADTALIDVALSLPPGKDAFGRVELLVTDLKTTRIISRMQHDIGKFSPAGVSHVAFLYPIGCAGIKVEARAKTAGIRAYSSSKFISLPFGCSE